MLTDKQIPKEFWPEAVNWAVHVLNRCPTLAVKDKTPQEAWNGLKPSVEHFKVFGCIGHVHIPDNKRQKLDNKSFKCVFLGISEESKAYRLFDPEAKRIVISRDVIFEEEEKWNWGKSVKEIRCDTLEWGDEEDGEETEEEDNEEEEQVEQPAEGGISGFGSGSSSSSEAAAENVASTPLNTPSHAQGRIRREPAWMGDYVIGEGLSEEEEMMHQLVMFQTSLLN